MLIESVFQMQGEIPAKYTKDGENVSPPLKFLQIPSNAVSLVLIVDDPDAPKGVFDHWIIWNIPANVKSFQEGAAELFRLKPSPMQGNNSYGNSHYEGPNPPPGKPHHYHFKLYALDSALHLPSGSTKKQVEDAMNGHIISQAELVGVYQR